MRNENGSKQGFALVAAMLINLYRRAARRAAFAALRWRNFSMRILSAWERSIQLC